MNHKFFTLLKPAYFCSALVLVTLFMVESCKKKDVNLDKFDFSEWNPDIAVPLASIDLGVNDILSKTNGDNIIKTDSNKFCYLVSRGNLFSVVAADLVKLPDYNYQYKYTLSAAEIITINTLPVGSTSTFTTTNEIDFQVNPATVAIDNVTFKEGLLKVGIISNVRQNLQAKVTISGAKVNGTAFSTTLNADYTGSLPVIATKEIDLKNYKFDLTANGGVKNKIAVVYEIQLTKTNNPSLIGEDVSFYEDLTKLKFSSIVGDIGQQTITTGQDTVNISIFNNTLNGGTFTLEEPRIQLFLSNSYGAPVNFGVQQVWGYRKATNLTYPVILPAFYSSFNINYPNQNEPGQVKETIIPQLDKTNSNFPSVISNMPNKIIYKVSAKTNIFGPAPASNRNVIVDSSRFKIDFEVYLPFWGAAKDFVITDTAKIDFKDYPQQASKVLIRNYVVNSFPVDIALQLYLADDKGVIKDSLVKSANRIIIPAAKNLDAQGRVQSPTSQLNDFVFDQERLKSLNNIKKIIIVGRAATLNNGATPVRFYSDYNLKLNLGIQATPIVKQ